MNQDYPLRERVNISHSVEHHQKSENSKTRIHKRPWTEEEDAMIRNLVSEYGPRNWTKIAKHLPERHGKQCRERWFNHLDPTIKKTGWEES